MKKLLEDKSLKISERKKDHIDICLNEDVTYKKSNGFEKYDFVHNPLTDMMMQTIISSENGVTEPPIQFQKFQN